MGVKHQAEASKYNRGRLGDSWMLGERLTEKKGHHKLETGFSAYRDYNNRLRGKQSLQNEKNGVVMKKVTWERDRQVASPSYIKNEGSACSECYQQGSQCLTKQITSAHRCYFLPYKVLSARTGSRPMIQAACLKMPC